MPKLNESDYLFLNFLLIVGFVIVCRGFDQFRHLPGGLGQTPLSGSPGAGRTGRHLFFRQ